MEFGRLNVRRRIFSAILLAMVFMLVFSFFSFPNDQSNTSVSDSGTQNTAVNSQQTHPDSIQINLMENALRQFTLAVNAAFKYLGGLRYFLSTILFIPGILCFAWLSVYAFHYFHKKTKKSLPIIAVPSGGHAPPFTLA